MFPEWIIAPPDFFGAQDVQGAVYIASPNTGVSGPDDIFGDVRAGGNGGDDAAPGG
jgi:hypothetical protein